MRSMGKLLVAGLLMLLVLVAGCVGQEAGPEENQTTHTNDSGGGRLTEDSTNSVNHGRQDAIRYVFWQPDPRGTGGPSGDGEPSSPSGCSVADVEGLAPQALVTYVKTHNYTCLNDFVWTFDNRLATVITDDHMVAVLNQIEEDAPDYDGTNSGNMRELMFFVRVGYYHDFYQSSFNFSSSVEQEAYEAFDTFEQSLDLDNVSASGAQIIDEWFNALDAGYLGHRYLDRTAEFMNAFRATPEWHSSAEHRTAMFDVLSFLITRGVNTDNPRRSDFIGAIDQSFLNALEELALDTDLSQNNETEYIVSAAVWATGNILKTDQWREEARRIVTAIIDTHPRRSQPYLWGVYSLDKFGDCQTSRPNERICISDLAPEIEADILPHTYVFDDGALRVRTPLALDDVQVLYHAIKQIDSQFNRVTESILPLSGDPNGELIMIIYGTKSDYEDYQWFLYDLPTNNGGIYIEQDGTFYTYERTPQESVYTLEDLTRHEYVHYLVGRYLIEGLWGGADIYDNNRMVWFDEGLAEFFAWSTQADGVKERRTLVQLIQQDGSDRMTVREVLSARYGDFRFYRYSGTLFGYLYTNEKEELRELLQHAHTSNITGFDAIVNRLKNDAQLEDAYQAYLDDLIANVENLDDPYTTFPGEPEEDDVEEIEEEFQEAGGYLARCRVSTTSDDSTNTRFTCSGVLTGQLRDDWTVAAAWETFDAQLDELILNLNESDTNNFQGMNCRFGNIWFSTSEPSYPLTDYFCEGPLDGTPIGQDTRLERVSSTFNETRLGTGAACGYREVNKTQQVQEDFRTRTWQGTRATCINEDNSSVVCTHGVSSALYPLETGNEVLEAEMWRILEQEEAVLERVRPHYYVDRLSCTYLTNFTEVHYQGQKYLTTNNAECTVDGLLDDGLIEITEDVVCRKQLSTQVYSSATPDSVLRQELSTAIVELQEQVYAHSPSFYRDFSCRFVGDAQSVPYGDDKYMVREVACIAA